MTDRCVDSTVGNNANTGAGWGAGVAKATIAGAIAIPLAAGEAMYVAAAHAETTVGAVTWAFAGTVTSPNRGVCTTTAAAPPTVLATSGTASMTGIAGSLTITGHVYMYGLTIIVGAGAAGAPTISMCAPSNTTARYESCSFQLAGTAAAAVLRPIAPGLAGNRTVWKNCTVKFANVGQGIQLNSGTFNWNGGGFVAGGTNPTVLFSAFNNGAAAGSSVLGLVENVDFTNMGSAVNMSVVPPAGGVVTFRNCKMPAAWSGSPINGSFTSGSAGRVEMYNCDNAATNYRLWIEDGAGSIKNENTLIRTGGASDGTTGLSWKMVSNANVGYPTSALMSPEIAIWNDTTGVSKTVTVEILRDSATNLKDNEIWVDVQYYGSAATPVGTQITDQTADVLTTAADQAATAAAAWTTTGMASPNKQALSVTFTPQMKGFFLARVMLAKPSTTVYVDPKITVT